MYWLLAEMALKELPPIHGQTSLCEEYHAFVNDINRTQMPEIIHLRKKLVNKDESDMRKIISSISMKIKHHVKVEEGRDAALPTLSRGVYALSVPVEYIVVVR